MIEIIDKQIRIDGAPQLLLCGEIHYFRLDRRDWQDRIDKLKLAGCNAVASYVPWLIHEEREGEVDLTGARSPELDLAAFLDLCRDNGLFFFLRPGPFIMAEMKNEGLPYWLYTRHPEIVPAGWDGRPAPTKTVDYLAPAFLAAVRRWYKAVMEIASPRLQPRGGNIIAIQLDNEIGMLSWVGNSPDLTETVLAGFAEWLADSYSPEELAERYPFDLRAAAERAERIRSPREDYSPALHRDLGLYMRRRFSQYVDTLHGYAREFGAEHVPFVINIHGTSAGRAFQYPIGISQLYETYRDKPGFLAGSDIYLGDLTVNTFQDLYLINGFMDAVNGRHQPLSSVEFNCGDGNFGETFSERYDPSAADFKLRMCVAQGNRLINFYLFAGGFNGRLTLPPGDGNDRVAFTGERHGFAAPVSPEGKLNYTFPRMARGIRALAAVADKLAVMSEERDPVSFAFIPDYYMTEFRYPGSAAVQEIHSALEAARAGAGWETLARSMLLAGFRFGAVDVQNSRPTPETSPVLVLLSARYMAEEVQRRLADYVNAGGKLLLYGELPRFDMEARPCALLAETLGLKHLGERREKRDFYPSLVADGWAAPRPEVRTCFAERLQPVRGGETLFRLYGGEEACAFDLTAGHGRAIVFAMHYRTDIALFRQALEKLGAVPGLTHDCPEHGLFITSTRSQQGERFLHALNLDGFDKAFRMRLNGEPLFAGKELTLAAKDGVMLPLGVAAGGLPIRFATAEIAAIGDGCVEFRLTQAEDWIEVDPAVRILPSADYRVERLSDCQRIVSLKHAKIDDRLRVHYRTKEGEA